MGNVKRKSDYNGIKFTNHLHTQALDILFPENESMYHTAHIQAYTHTHTLHKHFFSYHIELYLGILIAGMYVSVN